MTEAINLQSEKQFASNFLTLLSVSGSPLLVGNDYRKDIKDLKRLGIALPQLPYSKQNSKTINREKVILSLAFKSIKPPRFSIDLSGSSTDTVFEAKQLLLQQQQLKGIQASDLKLLIKGKVIHDSTLLSSLVEKDSTSIKFTVLINKSISNTPEPEVSIPEPETEIQLPWTDLKSFIQDKVDDPNYVIERLQRGWELTK